MRTFTLAIFISLISLQVNAQMMSPTVVASSGDYFVNSLASMSITIGEPITETVYGDGSILTQGFQQGHYFAVSINTISLENLKAEVYPQPANKDLYIKMSAALNKAMQYELTDITGKMIFKGYFTEQVFVIDVSELPAGMYLLNLKSSDAYKQTFRIIKE